ncbi:MAG: hypothetical protein K5793_02030 [Nitrosarchaeum sp.]|nr:hypothetical protein [Nitrosarchaeum sp.]MCV0400062.1 hypothetical protein [Nitrosarchaeum sp.]
MKNKEKPTRITALILSAILLVSAFSANAYAEDKNPNVRSIKIEYNAKIAKEMHYIQFKTCIGNKYATSPTFVIESDVGTKTIKFQKLHESNTCKSYETRVDARHFASIKIQMSDLSNFV